MGTWESAQGEAGFNDVELLSACRVLFGPEVELSPEFLWYLQPEGAKSAYRKKVRESHPDAHPWAATERLQLLQHEFVQVSDAYRQLSAFLVQRPQPRTVSECFAGGRTTPPRQGQQTTATWQAGEAAGNELYHSGGVPLVELKFGRYLYFRGVVTFQAVMRALLWQREQRPSIGKLARQRGWLDNAEVHRILQSGRVQGRFGERAVKLGLLAEWQLQDLLWAQQQRQQRLGNYFVKYHALSRQSLDRIEHDRLRHNLRARGC